MTCTAKRAFLLLALMHLSVQMMRQMWPYIGEYVEGLLRTTIQQSIQGSLPSRFQNFSFATIDLGDVVCCNSCMFMKCIQTSVFYTWTDRGTEIELTDYWWFRFWPLLWGHFIGNKSFLQYIYILWTIS